MNSITSPNVNANGNTNRRERRVRNELSLNTRMGIKASASRMCNILSRPTCFLRNQNAAISR